MIMDNYNQWITDLSKNFLIKIENIVNVWRDIGIINEKYTTRSNSITKHVYELLDTMLAEEKQHKINLELNIENLKEELQLISNQLNIINITFPEEYSLVVTEQKLLLERDRLAVIKQHRMQRYHKLIDLETELCECLFEYRKVFEGVSVPSEEQLEEFESHIGNLMEIKKKRESNFRLKRSKIIETFKLLDKTIPNDVFVMKIINDEFVEEVPLSEDFLNQCDLLIKQLLDEYERNKVECVKLRNRYSVLFKILYPNRGDAISSEYTSIDSIEFTCKTLEKLRSDVSLLERCRLDKLGEFIQNYQTQIREKLNSNLLSHFTEKDRYRYLLNSKDYNEELLCKIEKELDHLIEIEKIVSPIIKEINNWNVCFSKLGELKLKSKDPIVLKNRGGILLKVEKEKTAVKKELPKSESRIKVLLSSLKSDLIVADDLLIDNMKILDYLVHQWNHLDDEKENDRKLSSKSDLSKSTSAKSTIQKKAAPLSKLNTVLPTNIIPSKVADSTGRKPPGFKIPQLKKIPTKQLTISPIKVAPVLTSTLDRRFSRSCSNLFAPKLLKSAITASNGNLYGIFCKNITKPGVTTSSFINRAPI